MNEMEKSRVPAAEELLPAEGAPAEGAPVPAEAEELNPDAEKMERMARDVREFTRRYPQVDLERLRNDGNFLLFCGSRLGSEPLIGLFEDYAAILQNIREEERARSESKAERGTASGGTGGAQALTAEEQKELDAWNRAYPQLRMSAKEFQSR